MLKYSIEKITLKSSNITLKEVENHVKILHSVLFHCWAEKCPLSYENWVPRVKENLINIFLRFTWSERMLLQIYQCIWFRRKLFTTIVTKNNISQNVICSQYMITIYDFPQLSVPLPQCPCCSIALFLEALHSQYPHWTKTSQVQQLCSQFCVDFVVFTPLPNNGFKFNPVLGTHGHWVVRVL